MTRYKVQRRRSQRQWVAVPVVIRHGDSRIDGISINLSDGGIYLFAAANLSLGAQIEVEFRPPGGKQLFRTCGTVRRRAVYLYGIEFLKDNVEPVCDRTPAETQLLKPSITSLLSRPIDAT